MTSPRFAQYSLAFPIVCSRTHADENPAPELDTMKVSGPAGITLDVAHPAKKTKGARARIAGRILMDEVLPHPERAGNGIPFRQKIRPCDDRRGQSGSMAKAEKEHPETWGNLTDSTARF